MVRKHSRVAGENTSKNSTLFMELLSHLKSDINFASKGEEKKKRAAKEQMGIFTAFQVRKELGERVDSCRHIWCSNVTKSHAFCLQIRLQSQLITLKALCLFDSWHDQLIAAEGLKVSQQQPQTNAAFLASMFSASSCADDHITLRQHSLPEWGQKEKRKSTFLFPDY